MPSPYKMFGVTGLNPSWAKRSSSWVWVGAVLIIQAKNRRNRPPEGPEAGWTIGFQGVGCGILNQDFFLVGERLLWVVCGLTPSRSKGQEPATSGHSTHQLS
jgi:hypothetical protein